MLKTKKEHYKERTRQKMVETLIVFGQKYHSRHVNLVLKLRVNPNLGRVKLSRYARYTPLSDWTMLETWMEDWAATKFLMMNSSRML